ncbi:hypothetical protein ACP4OV_010408 [Aristida adscensionis]
MESVHLLTLSLALIVLLAVFRRRRGGMRPGHHHTTIIKVCYPAVARSMIVDHADAFSNRPVPPFPAGRPVTHSIASAPYGPFWRALRCNLTADILHRSRLGVLAPIEREAAEALAGSLAAQARAAGSGGDMVLRRSLQSGVFALVARLCFGDAMDARGLATMLRTQQEFFDSFVVVKAAERSWLTRLLHWRRRLRYAGTFHRVNEVVMPGVLAARKRRSQCGNNDGGGGGFRSYLDSLLELRVPATDGDDEHSRRPLTDDEVAFLAWEFVGAGTSGVVTCLEWTLAHLAAEPEIQAKLHREVAGDRDRKPSLASELRLPYLHAVVLESLRLHPPLPFASRAVHAADEGIAVGEAAVVPPGGAQVSFVLGAMGRDGEVWSDPDEFRPERFLDGGEGQGVGLVPGPKEIKMMPFGAGRRHCSGAAMGMAHIKCFLAELVRELEWAPPADGGGIDFTELDGFLKWMKTPLRVRITPRTRPSE